MMLNTFKINARCLELLKDMVRMAGGRTHFTRTELRAMHSKLRGRTGSPYFITKNAKARPSNRQKKLQNLPNNVFVVDGFLAYAKQHPPAPMPPKPKATAKREAKPKREAVARKAPARKMKAKAA